MTMQQLLISHCLEPGIQNRRLCITVSLLMFGNELSFFQWLQQVLFKNKNFRSCYVKNDASIGQISCGLFSTMWNPAVIFPLCSKFMLII
jgi:hypothetical protein